MSDAIKKGAFNHNFLREIIVRADFGGITDWDVAAILGRVREILKDDYPIYTERRDEEQLNKPVGEKEMSSIGKSYEFSKKEEDVSVDFLLTSHNLSLRIRKQKYVNFMDYMELYGSLLSAISKITSYFKVSRFGIRKVNVCYMKDARMVNSLFSKDYFSVMPMPQCSLHAFQAKDLFQTGKYTCSVLRRMEPGRYEGNIVSRALMDFQIYLEDEVTLKKLLSPSSVSLWRDMNDVLYDMYIKSLNEKFLRDLQNETTKFPAMGVYGICAGPCGVVKS